MATLVAARAVAEVKLALRLHYPFDQAVSEIERRLTVCRGIAAMSIESAASWPCGVPI